MQHLDLLHPEHWQAYKLLDSGGFEKLEQFGQYILRRPEPQAIWEKKWTNAEWEKKADATYRRGKSKTNVSNKSSDLGNWTKKTAMPDTWTMPYDSPNFKLNFKLALTNFGHIGVFPEQAANWEYMAQQLSTKKNATVLNLFAYTGCASLASKSMGADTTHVDAVKQVINWGAENMRLSNLTDIRWVVEDALKFAKREVKREKKYTGIILDPPAYGRGPDGEKWVLEEQILELIKLSGSLLQPKDGFLILNLYSMGLSALLATEIIQSVIPTQTVQAGELYIPSSTHQRLPLGTFVRITT